MGFMHIIPLYKYPNFFKLYDLIYAMEKIHGTSTWITYEANCDYLKYHSGGETGERFKSLFDDQYLKTELEKLSKENKWRKIKIHGECYGNKNQAMSKTYGEELKFIVFDVNVNGNFLDIPKAEQIAKNLGMEFVDYVIGPNTPDWIEEQSNRFSVQAEKNGCGNDKHREGVVVRPLIESTFEDGKRAIAKHKNAFFWEITTRRPLGERVKILENDLEIVEEWVTLERFKHVTDRVLQDKEDKTIVLSDIKKFIELMVEDVKREGEGEIVWSLLVEKGIKKKTGIMFKNEFKHLVPLGQLKNDLNMGYKK